jgi:hypothetical protein
MTERIRSKRFLLVEIPEKTVITESPPIAGVRLLADDGSATGVIPHLGESSWLRKPPGPVVVSPVVEPKEFTEAVFCGDSMRIVRWVA